MTNEKKITNKFNIGQKVFYLADTVTLQVKSFVISNIYLDCGHVYYKHGCSNYYEKQLFASIEDLKQHVKTVLEIQ